MSNNKVKWEEKTLRFMIVMYCRGNHGTSKGEELCTECKSVLEYSMERLSKCPLKPDKPACSKCHIHCYKPEYRESVRKIMRFSGPRMVYTHPVLAVRHLYNKLAEKQE